MNNIETVTLDNGLRIFLYKDERRHKTFFTYITLGGGQRKNFILDGTKYHLNDGLAHILEHYIVECNNNGNFIKKLGKMQMSTNAETSDIYTEYYFQAVENIDIGIKTILDAVNNVKFNEENLNKLKKPIIQEIRNRMDNKFYHLNKMVMNDVFGEENYIDVGGDIKDIENATIDEVEALYNACYKPDNQIIVIAGNFNKEKLNLEFYISCFFSTFFGVTSTLYKELVKKNVITDIMSCSMRKIDNYLLITIGNYTTNGDILSKKIIDTVKSMKKFNTTIFNLNKKDFIMELILRDESIFKMINPFITNVIFYDYPYIDTLEDVYNLTYEEYVTTIKSLDFNNYTDISIKN